MLTSHCHRSLYPLSFFPHIFIATVFFGDNQRTLEHEPKTRCCARRTRMYFVNTNSCIAYTTESRNCQTASTFTFLKTAIDPLIKPSSRPSFADVTTAKRGKVNLGSYTQYSLTRQKLLYASVGTFYREKQKKNRLRFHSVQKRFQLMCLLNVTNKHLF